MRREHMAVLLLLLVFLSTLTLGYGFISHSAGKLKISGPLQHLNDKPSEGNTPKETKNSCSGGGSVPGSISGLSLENLSVQFVPPDSNFRFVPTDIVTDCPVAVLPEDPELVCTDSPATSLPILPWREYEGWRFIIWYRGKYYIPRVTDDGDVLMLHGINNGTIVDTDRPLVFSSPGENISVRFSISGQFTDVEVKFAFRGTLVAVDRGENFTIFEYRVPGYAARDEIHRRGYYPFFVIVHAENRTYALLSWVAFLKKPIVEITDYPEELSGNGDHRIEISGRVYYPDGSPVPLGRIRVTMNLSKGTEGFVIGYGTVRDGEFTVRGLIRDSIPPGNYHLVAYYRGYAASPSNSDPIVSIRRKPAVDASVENDTLVLRIHWGNVPLANRTLLVVADNTTLEVRTDEKGLARVPIGASRMGEIGIVYPGDGLYLPVNKTVVLGNPEPKLTGEKTDLKILLRRLIISLSVMALIGTVVLAGRSLARFRLRTPSLSISSTLGEPVKFVEPVRRVFLQGEAIPVVLSGESELVVDGDSVGTGERFELTLPPGKHVLTAGRGEIELYVLPPRDAIIRLYELHFLPFASSLGVPTRARTPLEIARALLEKDIDEEPLFTLTEVFTRAKYSKKPVYDSDFWGVVDSLRRLGVL